MGDHVSALPALSMLNAEIYGKRFPSGMHRRNYVLAAGQIESKAFLARYERTVDLGLVGARDEQPLGYEPKSRMEQFAEVLGVSLPEEFSWIDYWALGERSRGAYTVFCGDSTDALRSLPVSNYDASHCIRLAEVSAGGEQKSVGFFARDFRQLAALIYNAKAVISVDSGPLHLACALGTPVVALYGPTGETIGTQYERYLEVNQIVVRGKKNKCTMPCYRNEKNGFSRCSSLRYGYCMSTITPKQIQEAYAGI